MNHQNNAPTANGGGRKHKNDIIFIAALLAVVIAVGLVYFFCRAEGDTVTVTVNGAPFGVYSLAEDRTVEIRTGEGGEELNLLINALGLEEDMDDLRYRRIIVATDADDDGMHIRMLVLTFFLKYYPDLVRRGHVYILQTPLFRVKNKNEVRYCYNQEEKESAIADLKGKVEITRFKGLGEISWEEFTGFIGKDMRLDKVRLSDEESIKDIMEFYMGENTYERQMFISSNLKSAQELEDINI